MLHEWLVKNPEDASVRSILAASLHETADIDAAMAEYETVLKTQPNNVLALNNLAWLYFERNDARALEVAQRAYERVPERPEIADNYGWILVQLGQVERGLAILDKAAANQPENGEILYHHAATLAKAGEIRTAKQQLQTLLTSGKEFGARSEAESLLKELQ